MRNTRICEASEAMCEEKNRRMTKRKRRGGRTKSLEDNTQGHIDEIWYIIISSRHFISFFQSAKIRERTQKEKTIQKIIEHRSKLL